MRHMRSAAGKSSTRWEQTFWKLCLIHCYSNNDTTYFYMYIYQHQYLQSKQLKEKYFPMFHCGLTEGLHPNSLSASCEGERTFGRWCLHGSLVCFHNSKVPKCLLMCTGPFLPRKTWNKNFSWGQKIEGSSKSALKTNWENSKCGFHQVWD